MGAHSGCSYTAGNTKVIIGLAAIAIVIKGAPKGFANPNPFSVANDACHGGMATKISGAF